MTANLVGAAGFNSELEIGGLAVTIKNFYKSSGYVAIDIGSNLFPAIGKFTYGEGAIYFNDIAATKEGDRGGLGIG